MSALKRKNPPNILNAVITRDYYYTHLHLISPAVHGYLQWTLMLPVHSLNETEHACALLNFKKR